MSLCVFVCRGWGGGVKKRDVCTFYYYFLLLCVSGIDGVLQAYANCIRYVQLYGPTNVAPIIQHVARFAAAAQKEEGTKGAHVRNTAIGWSTRVIRYQHHALAYMPNTLINRHGMHSVRLICFNFSCSPDLRNGSFHVFQFQLFIKFDVWQFFLVSNYSKNFIMPT